MRIHAMLCFVLLFFGLSPASGSTAERQQVQAAKKFYLVYNPHAGKKRAEKIVDIARDEFTKAGFEVDAIPTEYARHASELAEKLPLDNIAGFCVIGGDGTINEAVNGLLKREGAIPPLCVIPGGTGNSFMTDLGLDKPEDAIKAIIAGHTRAVDVGRVVFMNKEGASDMWYMINLVGLGIGVDANIKAEKMRWLGPIRYNLGILGEILKKRHHKALVEIDGVVQFIDFSLILVQNTIHGGKGLKLAPDAKIDDGQLDLVMALRMGRGKMFNLFSKIKKDGSHIGDPSVTYKKFKEIRVSGDKALPINIDGENCGTTPLIVSVVPQKIRVFAR